MNVAPHAGPQPEGQQHQALPAPNPSHENLPRANALPVPGDHSAPPVATGSVNPRASLSPSGAVPAEVRPEHRAGPETGMRPVLTPTPSGPAPGLHANRTPPGSLAVPAGRPASGPQRVDAPQMAPRRPDVNPRMERAAPPVARLSPPPEPARPMAPSRPMAPMVRTAPPPMVRAAPPPVMRAAPPPIQRAAPPPMARPSPPPMAMARPMAPPAMARPAAPPPRPAAPAGKRCPPNVGHC